MFKLKDMLKLSALSLVFSLLIIFSARAQTATNTPCSGSSCQTNAITTCTGGGGKWCLASDQVSGWCSYSASPCPANDAASCALQSGEWCTYTGTTGGYCNSVPGSCPINDQATCTSKSRTWCAGTNGAMGWCATTGSTCPINDAPSCVAQHGEWCAGTYGSTGWCVTGSNSSCPINDQATCTSKSRTWCAGTNGAMGWCATTGSTCPNTVTTTSTTPTPIYTPPPSTMSWPNTESDCTKYKGVWCKSTATYSTTYTMVGSCMMAGQTCPVSVPTGQMTCWDNSTVAMGSTCPTMPMTSADCVAKGANWCASTAPSTYSTGYCMGKTNPCPKYPPAGQMSCPDNVTFATSITDCPTVSSVPTPTYKLCPDGITSVLSDAVCPKPVVYVSCKDGTKVPEGTTCPVKTEDTITTCLNKSGKWCLDKTGGTGYCVTQGDCRSIVVDKGEPTVEKPVALDEKQTKLVEAKKKEYSKNLDTLEKTIKRFDDKQSLAKISALREKLSTLPADDSALDSLEAIKDDILALRDVKNNLIEQNGNADLTARDLAMQAKALKQLQRSIKSFANQLGQMQAKADKLEKQGFAVQQTFKDLLAQGNDLVNKIKSATTFEEARDASEALASLSEDLNLWLPKLEQLARVNQLSKVIDREITQREKEYKRVQALADRLKIDMGTYLTDAGAKVDSARAAYSQLQTKDWNQDDPLDFVQASIIDNLDDADIAMINVRELANLKASVNKTGAQIKRYDARIARLVKQKQDVSEMTTLLDQIKETYAQLKELSGQKLDELEVSGAVDKLGSIDSFMQQLDDLLKISAPSSLEKALRGGLKIETIQTPQIEQQVIRAYRVATFFRRAPEQMAEYFSSSAKSVTINKWRNRLAIDE